MSKRWDRQRLIEETGKTQQSAQARWFHKHYHIEVPTDALGPIMTDAAFEALIAKSCGVLNVVAQTPPRPAVQLVRRTGTR